MVLTIAYTKLGHKWGKCSAVENLDRIMRSIRDGLNSRVPVQIRLA